MNNFFSKQTKITITSIDSNVSELLGLQTLYLKYKWARFFLIKFALFVFKVETHTEELVPATRRLDKSHRVPNWPFSRWD